MKIKKPKMTLWNEFKAFINKGSVLDLAVGMIIGGAFTAIVSALVNNILKPLINWIPLSSDGTGLQTVLRPAVLDASGAVVTEALILDWGAVISAIITFLLTALVLFALIKAINSLRGGMKDAKADAAFLNTLSKEERAELKAKGMTRKEIKALELKRADDAKAAEEAAKAAEEAAEAAEEAAKPVVESTDDLLREIRDLLKAQNKPADKE